LKLDRQLPACGSARCTAPTLTMDKCKILKGALVSVGFPADENRLADAVAFLKKHGVLSLATFEGVS